MKKISKYLVEKRFIILAAMLIIAVICGILSSRVSVNSDMTKYLPDKSSMKAGIDIMDKEFPATEDTGDIRVMFNGLNDTQKEEVLNKLKAIQYVDSVDYTAGSSDYNNGTHTLYVVNFKYDYGTTEATAVEKAISSDFNNYDMVYHVDTDSHDLPAYMILLALAILMTVLILMCASWLEPVLILVTIGVAIVINMGTNLFLGTISETTKSIASILQLVLSMDYSMILINRYRQELTLNADPKTAMKNALGNALAAIISSALATIVGLLALCFMSFKIGTDLSLVLAKGVLCSMLCIITILPALLVMCDKGIKKTAKKVLPIKMDAIGRFSNKFRFVATGVFVVIFVGAFMLSQNTKLAYVLAGSDPTEQYFPKDSKIVLVYNNSDKDAAAKLADQYASNPSVKDVQSYSTTLGKEYTAKELSDQLASSNNDSGLKIDASLLNIIYYDYFKGNTQGTITVGDFINFLENNVATNESFADQLGGDIKDKLDAMKKFADPANLTQPMSAQEIANFFGMNQDHITQIFMFYYIKNGGANTGTMTLPQFADFITNDVASNKEYASMLDKNTLSMINQLKTFTNKATVTKSLTVAQLATTLGMDENTVKLLMVYYKASQADFDAGTMTLPQFVGFLTKDVASNQMFSSYFDSATLAQMSSLAQFTNTAVIQKQMTSTELATALHMDATMVEQILQMLSGVKGTTVETMSMQEFVDFLCSNVITNAQYASQFDQATIGQLKFMQSIMNATVSGQALGSSDMAKLFGMEPSMVRMIYTYYIASYGDTSAWKQSVQSMINFMVNDVASNKAFSPMFDSNTMNKLGMLQKLINGTVAGTSYTSASLSKLFGMDASQLNQLYLLYDSKYGDTSGWKMSVQSFVNFIISDVMTNEQFSGSFSANTASELKTAKIVIDASVSGNAYTAQEMSDMFSGLSDKLNAKTMDLMYLYYFSATASDPSWKLSINDMFSFLSSNILNDPRFDGFIDADMRAKIADMKTTLEDGIKQLTGPNYSRMILAVSLQDGSDESTNFVKDLSQKCKDSFSGNYYLIGNSPMVYEMSQTFDKELHFITILTAVAIFVVVALAFRSFLVSLILVLIIQGGVYLTIVLCSVNGNSIYYLALLIVQCILMGATIDYGILFASYYKETRPTTDRKNALIAAYNGSIHTILTSGLIMVFVTGILGYAFQNPTVGQICLTIAKGALCAVVLIIFILPGVIAAFDKFINKRKKTV